MKVMEFVLNGGWNESNGVCFCLKLFVEKMKAFFKKFKIFSPNSMKMSNIIGFKSQILRK